MLCGCEAVQAVRMARQPRTDLAGIPQHVVQRGNNRMLCFLDDDDRQRYLASLRDALRRFDCVLHAYVLMSNHVHLLVTPCVAGGVSRLMQYFGRGYAQMFNGRHRRSGTLWEGRFRSCLVDSETYVLRCYRYIELNPVRAWMVEAPQDYPWSSHVANALVAPDAILTPHAAYLSLGGTAEERAIQYRGLFQEAMSAEMLAEIRVYLQQQRALGSSAFQQRIERQTSRYAGVRPAHRPPRSTSGMPE